MTDPSDTSSLDAFDRWGPLQFPTQSNASRTFVPRFDGWGLPAPGPSTVPSSDPALACILDFLGCYLITDQEVSAAWQDASAGGGGRCIRNLFLHDPRKGDFNSEKIPALYAWRESSKQEWVADNWLYDQTVIKALWVFPITAAQSQKKIRIQFVHVLAKAINLAIEWGRTPSWKQPGDTDPQTPNYGSLFWPYAGFASFWFESWAHARAELPVPQKQGTYDAYPAIDLTFTLKEKVKWGIGKFPKNAGATNSVSVEGASAPYPTWSATTVYPQGAFVVPPTPNGLYYMSTTGGLSGATAPAFPTTPGATVKDGAVVWMCVGRASTVIDSGPMDTTPVV